MSGPATRRSGSDCPGTVDAAALELLLSGRDPVVGSQCSVGSWSTGPRRMVGWCGGCWGSTATLWCRKPLSAWWALTGDRCLLEAHDVAVSAALEHL